MFLAPPILFSVSDLDLVGIDEGLARPFLHPGRDFLLPGLVSGGVVVGPGAVGTSGV